MHTQIETRTIFQEVTSKGKLAKDKIQEHLLWITVSAGSGLLVHKPITQLVLAKIDYYLRTQNTFALFHADAQVHRCRNIFEGTKTTSHWEAPADPCHRVNAIFSFLSYISLDPCWGSQISHSIILFSHASAGWKRHRQLDYRARSVMIHPSLLFTLTVNNKVCDTFSYWRRNLQWRFLKLHHTCISWFFLLRTTKSLSRKAELQFCKHTTIYITIQAGFAAYIPSEIPSS